MLATVLAHSTGLMASLSLERAKQAQVDGKPAEAVTHLQRYLGIFPDDNERLMELGLLLADLAENSRGRFQAYGVLEEVLRLTLRSIQGSLRHRARTVVELQPVPPVVGSATQLGQIALNLLVNALQAMPDEYRDDHQVSIRLRRSEDFAVLEIEDTGPGIPPETLARIFDPFFTTKSEGGTGLGLAISRRIIQELGGEIEVRSELGKGTCFTVRLPLASPPQV